MFYADEFTGRGSVLYHRYDGHYGPITPPDSQTPFKRSSTVKTDRSAKPPDVALHPAGRDVESAVERVELLEAQVQALGQAIRALIKGMEEIPDQEPDAERPARAARLAHELLLSQGL